MFSGRLGAENPDSYHRFFDALKISNKDMLHLEVHYSIQIINTLDDKYRYVCVYIYYIFPTYSVP